MLLLQLTRYTVLRLRYTVLRYYSSSDQLPTYQLVSKTFYATYHCNKPGYSGATFCRGFTTLEAFFKTIKAANTGINTLRTGVRYIRTLISA